MTNINKFSNQKFKVLNLSYASYKPYIQKIASRIRKNQHLQVWYLENSGRLAYFDGITVNSGNLLGTKLVYIKEKNTIQPSIFGFVPNSPRILLIR